MLRQIYLLKNKLFLLLKYQINVNEAAPFNPKLAQCSLEGKRLIINQQFNLTHREESHLHHHPKTKTIPQYRI